MESLEVGNILRLLKEEIDKVTKISETLIEICQLQDDEIRRLGRKTIQLENDLLEIQEPTTLTFKAHQDLTQRYTCIGQSIPIEGTNNYLHKCLMSNGRRYNTVVSILDGKIEKPL